MNHQKQLDLAKVYEQKQTNEKLQLAIKLSTRAGFFKYYFEQLSIFPNHTECFNAINLLHNKIFGEYKYSDYNSFRKQKRTYLKDKK